tara:strand:- start:717 stop:1220 length:504 start_codon:yes stop_codon:yes gene_type:complete
MFKFFFNMSVIIDGSDIICCCGLSFSDFFENTPVVCLVGGAASDGGGRVGMGGVSERPTEREVGEEEEEAEEETWASLRFASLFRVAREAKRSDRSRSIGRSLDANAEATTKLTTVAPHAAHLVAEEVPALPEPVGLDVPGVVSHALRAYHRLRLAERLQIHLGVGL